MEQETKWKTLSLNDILVTVGSDGTIKNKSGKVLTRRINNVGYARVSIGSRYYLVHRLVLQAFVGEPPEGHQGCHRDGDKLNCTLENLRWGTLSENCRERERGIKLSA